MYMVMCFACIVAVLTNHSGWSITVYHTNIKIVVCAMLKICVFDRKVWLASIIVSSVSRGGQ